MTAIEFAQLLKAKRVGMDKWIAMCPVHEQGGKHRPSLSIAKGRKTAIVFKCMSAGCTQKEILDAMGLTWQSILGDRDVTKEMRGRWADERKLEDMEHDLAIVRWLAVVDKPKRKYWDATARNMKVRIQDLRSTLYPEETALSLKRERVRATIETHGFDAVWTKFLSTARGQLLDQQYGVTDDRGRHILPVADHRQDVEAIIRGSGDTSPAGGDRAALANPFRPRNE
jgi:hypothetical protein